MSDEADFLAHDLLALPKKSKSVALRLFVRYGKILTVFALSGLLHTAADIAAGLPFGRSYSADFFMWQTVGIMIEDLVLALASPESEQGKRNSNSKVFALMRRIFGHLWVAAWMAWSVPVWIFPTALFLNGQEHRGLVPYSILLRKWT